MIQFMYINIYSVLYMHTNTFRHIINKVVIYQNANSGYLPVNRL